MGLDDIIIVNDFSFCLDHRSEYCHVCGCDYRTVNNFQIEGELSAALQKEKMSDMTEFYVEVSTLSLLWVDFAPAAQIAACIF